MKLHVSMQSVKLRSVLTHIKSSPNMRTSKICQKITSVIFLLGIRWHVYLIGFIIIKVGCTVKQMFRLDLALLLLQIVLNLQQLI